MVDHLGEQPAYPSDEIYVVQEEGYIRMSMERGE